MRIRMPSKQYDNVVDVLQDIYKLIRANVTFGDMTVGDEGQNIAGTPVLVTSHVTPDTEFTVTHNLNVIPTGFLVLNKDKAGDFYGTPTSGTDWTITKIFIKCNVASVTAQLFILA